MNESIDGIRPCVLLALAALAAALLVPLGSFAETQATNKTIPELNVMIQEIDGEIRIVEQEILQTEINIAGIDREIQKNDAIITNTTEMISKARQKKNAPAEAAARDALEGAQRAKKKGEDTRAGNGELKKLRAALEAARARESTWKDDTRKLIAGSARSRPRPANSDDMSALNDPSKKRSRIQTFRRASGWGRPARGARRRMGLGRHQRWKGIRYFDKSSSWEKGTSDSRASHTLLCLKTVNGKKFFLDNQSGEGPRIKTEDQILLEYGARTMDVARPLR